MPIIVETISHKKPARRIAVEAERRMAVGMIVNGVPFRCDDASAQRLGEMLQRFQDRRVGPEGLSFRTMAGHTIILSRKAQAVKLVDALRDFRAACLAASVHLQESPPQDPLDDRHWPKLPILTV